MVLVFLSYLGCSVRLKDKKYILPSSGSMRYSRYDLGVEERAGGLCCRSAGRLYAFGFKPDHQRRSGKRGRLVCPGKRRVFDCGGDLGAFAGGNGSWLGVEYRLNFVPGMDKIRYT